MPQPAAMLSWEQPRVFLIRHRFCTKRIRKSLSLSVVVASHPTSRKLTAVSSGSKKFYRNCFACARRRKEKITDELCQSQFKETML